MPTLRAGTAAPAGPTVCILTSPAERVAASKFRCGRGCTRSDDPVLPDHLRVPSAAELRRALLGAERDVDDAEPFVVALGPLEVVEQRPDEIAADVVALGDGPVQLDQVAAQVLAAIQVDDLAGRR